MDGVFPLVLHREVNKVRYSLTQLRDNYDFSRDGDVYQMKHYRARWQPMWAILGLIGSGLIILFSGWPAIYILRARHTLSTDALLKDNKYLAADLVGAYSGVSSRFFNQFYLLSDPW